MHEHLSPVCIESCLADWSLTETVEFSGVSYHAKAITSTTRLNLHYAIKRNTGVRGLQLKRLKSDLFLFTLYFLRHFLSASQQHGMPVTLTDFTRRIVGPRSVTHVDTAVCSWDYRRWRQKLLACRGSGMPGTASDGPVLGRGRSCEACRVY